MILINENDISYERNISRYTKMNDSSSLSSPSSKGTSSSLKSTHTDNKNKDTVSSVVTINETVNLTERQHQVLKTICDTYQMSFSEYMQQALVEAMRFDIEEGNLCDALLEKIGAEDSKKDNTSSPSSAPASPFAPDLMNSDLDLLKKLQAQTS
jgi:anti-sigma28 factor (negative regulator of flagellin synthesis)